MASYRCPHCDEIIEEDELRLVFDDEDEDENDEAAGGSVDLQLVRYKTDGPRTEYRERDWVPRKCAPSHEDALDLAWEKCVSRNKEGVLVLQHAVAKEEVV